jgi:type I restriction enzyme R subunit
MSEYAYVEQPILGWLCGEPKAKYGAQSLGWTYRDEIAMASYARPLEDPVVESLLVAAILRINPVVKTEEQAKLAVAALRKTMSHLDKLTANRQTLDLLRDGAKVVLEPGADAKTVHFIEFDLAASENGRLRHGDGGHEGGARRRRGLVLTILSCPGLFMAAPIYRN